MHTTVGIATLWATALASSRTLRRWSLDRYGKAVALRVGVDMRRPPDESDAPFIALFPDAVATGPGRKANEHEVGLLIGLSEEGFENREGVMLMTGMLRLAEVWELVRKSVEQAVPGVSLGDVSAEYHLAGYPLVMLDATLTATESLPVGRRLNKSEQKITDKTFETIEAAKAMIDVEAVKAAMNLATKTETRFNNAD